MKHKCFVSFIKKGIFKSKAPLTTGCDPVRLSPLRCPWDAPCHHKIIYRQPQGWARKAQYVSESVRGTPKWRAPTTGITNRFAIHPLREPSSLGWMEKQTNSGIRGISLAGAWTQEDQIEKNQQSYRDGTNKIPGFVHMPSVTMRCVTQKLFPDCPLYRT